MNDADQPQDEQPREPQAATPEPEAPTPEPDAEAVTPEPDAEAVTPEPDAEAVTPEPDAEAVTPAPEPKAVTPEPEPEAPAETPAPADPPAPEAAETPQAAEIPAQPEATEARPDAPALEVDPDVTPRQKPEIPGADLVPDIVQEGEGFLDAEAQAAAEAEAEARAARARQESEDESRPIADAAINLAAGARYTATGKRKSAVARVIIKPGTGTYVVNGKTLEAFFPRETLQRVIRQPLETVGYESRMDIVAAMHGGGVSAQAGALRHGISKALLEADPNLRGELKRRGFLTRDPRVKERKKAGLKKARKRPQFSKR